MSKVKPQINTNELIRRLRLMAESGGMLSKDRIEAVRQAADRLEDLDERIAIMTENYDPHYGMVPESIDPFAKDDT